MRSGGKVALLALHITAVVVLIISIGFTIAGFMSTAWQKYEEPGTNEIHQHGLWMDYIYAVRHVAGHDERAGWHEKPKFGVAVDGDEGHRAQPVHVNTLILLIIATILAMIGCVCSLFAFRSMGLVIGWIVMLFLSTLLSASAVIMFYVFHMGNRFVTTDKKLEQEVGYSFWYALTGSALFALAMLLAMAYAVLTVIGQRGGDNDGDNNDHTFRGQFIRPPKSMAPTKQLHHITSL